MIRTILKNPIYLSLISLAIAAIMSKIIISGTNYYLVYDEVMKLIVYLSSFGISFSVFKIFFSRQNNVFRLLFCLFYFGLIYVFLFCRGGDILNLGENYNLNLFAYDELNPQNSANFKLSIYNIILFLPFGMLSAKYKMLRPAYTAVFIVMIILIEYFQVYLGVGVFDITDIFLYLIGYFIGRLIADTWYKMRLKY